MTSTKRPGVGELGEAAKVSQVPQIKAIPVNIAWEENLKKLFIISDQWLRFDQCSALGRLHRASLSVPNCESHDDHVSGYPTYDWGLISKKNKV